MTYRDDHDAALARAEALQRELERSEADRDRLQAEVARLEHSPEPAPGSALMVAAPRAMTAVEIKELADELDAGLRASRSRGRWQIALACLLIATGMAGFWVSLVTGVAFSVIGMLVLFTAAVGNGGDHKAILAAVCDAPERIVALRDISSPFDRGCLKISTEYHAAYCNTREPRALLAKLARRCPRAVV